MRCLARCLINTKALQLLPKCRSTFFSSHQEAHPGPWRAQPRPPGARPYSIATQTRLKLGDLFKTSPAPHWNSCDYFKWWREKSSRTWRQRMLVFLTAGKENKMKKNIPHEILTVKNINHAVFNWGHRVSSHYSGHVHLAMVRQLRDRQTVLMIFSWLPWAVALVSEKRQIPRGENWRRNMVQSWVLRRGRRSWAGYYIFPWKSCEDFSAVSCHQYLGQDPHRGAPAAAGPVWGLIPWRTLSNIWRRFDGQEFGGRHCGHQKARSQSQC